MINSLNPNATLFSADKLKSEIELRFLIEREKIIKILQKNDSKLSFTLDLWTSPNGYSILGITVHFLNSDWEKKNMIISFKEVEGSHSGENICKSFVEVLKDYRISYSKVMGITCDNVSSNNTFVESLKLYDDSITDDMRIRCFPHIINLAVQIFFKSLKSTNSIEDEEDWMNVSIVKDLRAIVKFIRESPQRVQKFLKICKNEDLDELHLIIDVITRWNSTYEMIKRALALKKGINSFLISERKNEMMISDDDWDKLETLTKVLEKFSIATKVSSGSSYPSIASTLALKIWINKSLNNYKKEFTYLEEAISMSLDKIEEYTGVFEQSKLLIISMILNPSLKLVYAKKNGWTRRDIKESQDIFEEFYRKYDDSGIFELSQIDGMDGSQDFLADIDKSCSTNKKDEVNKYLNDALCDSKVNIYFWWKANVKTYPVLAKMAKDILAVSGSSVPVECAFSGGVDLITSNRNKLAPESINICMCLKDWFRKEN